MKKVFVIERSADVLNTVKHYLREDGISYTAFRSVRDAIESPDIPALIILFGSDSISEITQDIATLKDFKSFIRVPKVLILPLDTIIETDDLRGVDIQEHFSIPVERLKFQSAISRFLMQSPRRVFRILVTIMHGGSSIRYSGISIDFSESGMALECTSDFPVGDKLQITFVNPKNRNRISLNAEVVRRTATPSGSGFFYGLMFKQMSGKDVRTLSDFISGRA